MVSCRIQGIIPPKRDVFRNTFLRCIHIEPLEISPGILDRAMIIEPALHQARLWCSTRQLKLEWADSTPVLLHCLLHLCRFRWVLVDIGMKF
jgi:hypothetical protein